VNISAPFIRRPVATTLLTAGITLVGAIAFNVLPVSPLPQVDFPTISVRLVCRRESGNLCIFHCNPVGAPIQPHRRRDRNDLVKFPWEHLDNSAIRLSRNIDGAARDVEAAINAARTYLPANLPANPTYRKVNPADAPIMILGLTSDKYDKPTLYDEASSIMAQKLSQIAGVGQVSVSGGSGPSVRVEVNPTLLNSHGLTIQNVQSMLISRMRTSRQVRSQTTIQPPILSPTTRSPMRINTNP